ncbi:putative UPF0481 protein [Camellia lanceoleosa]|uniref:UPF0481 protein n=1 Tax=Camellia lanceoleosa TaxID=1840588 RepID=A0ACC0GCX2_9ERIC|nr:putative UPF0481 protein [Camellia lanceoleosa]
MITAFIKRISDEPGERGGLMEKIQNFFQKNVWRTQSHREMMQQRNSEDNPPFIFLNSDFTSVGIQFKPSMTSQLTDIDFKSTCTSGTLQLPPIIVDDITKSILLNLATYEACPDSIIDVGVTSYICFMDSLIDQDEDVKVLRAKGILINFLGSDGHVADLFNEIATDLVPSPHAYVEVKNKIEKHQRNRMKIWIADWLHTYFRNPWTFIAVTTAILAIILSVFQTILAAI